MAEIKIKTILVPTDFSEYVDLVMDYAVFLAKSFGARIKLLHVVQSVHLAEAINWMDAMVPPAGEINISEQLRKNAQKKLGEFRERYRAEGVEVEILISEGVPFVEIIQCLERESVDMVVMGSHGRTGITHLLMGSVAEKVVRKAPCPVLCIKPEGFKFEMP